ncbi:MAG: hypothetical protein AB7F64_04910 [Gammaproteobacteria bacterium]
MQNSSLPTNVTKSSIQPSTHGVAPEASAARLLKLLRVSYPEIHEIAEGASEAIQAQGSLIDYAKKLMEVLEKSASVDKASVSRSTRTKSESLDFSAISKPTHPHIDKTVLVIQRLLASSVYSASDKKLILEQLVSMASTCPGLNWDENHLQWSTNRIWNAQTKREERVIASVAETLNLVSCALLDTHRFEVSDDELKKIDSETEHAQKLAEMVEKDMSLRLENLFNLLLELQEEVERGHLNKCSAGRQHDLLWLLDKRYLDKPVAPGQGLGDANPIELIEETKAFLLDSLSEYLIHLLNCLDEKRQSTLLLDWVQWYAGLSDNEECRVLAVLRMAYPSNNQTPDSGWQANCLAFLTERCEQYGLNPSAYVLEQMIANLGNIRISKLVNVSVLLVQELSGAPVQSEAGYTEPLLSCIRIRNRVLKYFKIYLNAKKLLGRTEAVKAFYRAEFIFQSLLKHVGYFLFMGVEDEFKQSFEAVTPLLTTYYKAYLSQQTLPVGFDLKKLDYLALVAKFKQQNPMVDFVENFFVKMGINVVNQAQQLGLLDKLTIEQKNGILVPDEMIARFMQSHVVVTDNQAEVALSSYEINRLLLHGLLTYQTGWSKGYCDAMIWLIPQLLAPDDASVSVSLRSLKAAYSKQFLSNLLTMALIERDEATLSESKEIYRNFSLEQVNQSFFLLDFLVSADRADMRTKILETLQAHLGTLIQNFDQLRKLFTDSEEQLSEAETTIILDAVEDRLGIWIQHYQQLHELFQLSEAQLSLAQRTMILDAVKNRLGIWIQHYYQLHELLQLPEAQLSEVQRTVILDTLKDRLGIWIEHYHHLYGLFQLSEAQLSLAQRTLIWDAVKGRLGIWIQHYYQLHNLFMLSEAQLSEVQRTVILDALKGRLAIWIQHYYQLHELFQLSEAQLSLAQRTVILDALKGHWETLIGYAGLYGLFSLSKEQLSEEQRTLILDEVKDRLDSLIGDGGFYKLFKLSKEQLSQEQRNAILDSMNERLVMLIQDAEELYKLFQLPEALLSEAQRTVIWDAVKNNFGMPPKRPDLPEVVSVTASPSTLYVEGVNKAGSSIESSASVQRDSSNPSIERKILESERNGNNFKSTDSFGLSKDQLSVARSMTVKKKPPMLKQGSDSPVVSVTASPSTSFVECLNITGNAMESSVSVQCDSSSPFIKQKVLEYKREGNIFQRTDTPKVKIVKLLKNYISPGSSYGFRGFSRILTGHVGRHHLDDADQLLADIRFENDLGLIQAKIESTKLRIAQKDGYNPNGSFTARLVCALEIIEEAGLIKQDKAGSSLGLSLCGSCS